MGLKMSGWYDIAQVCLNGHVMNEMVKSSPQHNQKFCDKCGSVTITECPHCNTPIRGYYHADGVISLGFKYSPPRFCYNCGKPFPWTEKALKAAKELADEIENLTKEEKEILKQSLDDLVKESPNVQVAALKFKKIMKKVGKTSTQAFKEILISILSESVKKLLWG